MSDNPPDGAVYPPTSVEVVPGVSVVPLRRGETLHFGYTTVVTNENGVVMEVDLTGVERGAWVQRANGAVVYYPDAFT